MLDQAYREYIDDPDYPDGIEEYFRGGRRVIVLRTFSKIYGLAGLRVGYGIARPEITAALHQVREPFNVNMLAQEAVPVSERRVLVPQPSRCDDSRTREEVRNDP